jgi:Amiloride-sensitive sodium channel
MRALCPIIIITVVWHQTEAVNRVRQLNLIHRNFIQLNFAFAEQRPYVITDTPQTTLADLLCNVGGTFSLWLGMTVMCLVEVVELTFKIGYSMIIAGKKKKSVDTVEVAE